MLIETFVTSIQVTKKTPPYGFKKFNAPLFKFFYIFALFMLLYSLDVSWIVRDEYLIS